MGLRIICFSLARVALLQPGIWGASSRISGTAPATTNYTAGFGLNLGGGAGANILHGSIVMTLIGSNIWSAMGVFSISNNNATVYTSGSIALGGVLDRLRLTTVGGTDTFDAGSVNVLYE